MWRRGIRSLLFTTPPPPSPNTFSFHNLLRTATTTTTIPTHKASAESVLKETDELLLEDIPPPLCSSSSVIDSEPTLLLPRVVLYDGVCHLCHRGVKWVIKADKNELIKFCCLQSKAAEPYLRYCSLDREDVLRRFLFVEGPEYYQGSTAALKIASYLPLPYSALSVLLVIPTPLRDAVYDYVAKNRYKWFGKEDNCIVLEKAEMMRRFIDRDEMMKKVKTVSEDLKTWEFVYGSHHIFLIKKMVIFNKPFALLSFVYSKTESIIWFNLAFSLLKEIWFVVENW
ncbi:hypothetical protein QJS10_CPB15g01812 [Acorus calamus]|uniref:Thiol-disulfide oxidoreductase DCC n=1 Tax=Acorus calamus TaxID=4465 RepID=A0AAV9D5C3_ACOCL|nr:hypothetical protein QJS10_CPB15g01812 [Acorus calamus]